MGGKGPSTGALAGMGSLSEALPRHLALLPVRRWILRRTRRPPVGDVSWGQLRRTEPISRRWGGDRGLPVDRHFIESFLGSCASDIHGRVLEVGGDRYTRRFGGERVERAEIVHAPPGHPRATFVADFSDAPELPSAAFDCVICTQTLQLIPDLGAAVSTLHRILKPGGTVLATLPGISQVWVDSEQRWQDFWRFTTHSARWLFARSFGASAVSVRAYGNVLVAVAFLQGLATEELEPEELAETDPRYQLLVAVRAVRGDAGR